MMSIPARWRVLLALALVAIVAVVALTLRTQRYSPVSLPTADVPAPAGPVDVGPAQAAASAIAPVVEIAPVAEVLQLAPAAHNAEAFETLMRVGAVSGGESLERAFDIHDSCMGVPRSERGLNEWLADNASTPDVDYDLMKRRTQECIGVPALTFDTRRRMLQPLAESGDVHAQFLLATSFPYSMQAHTRWLRASAEGGYAPAMVLLAQSLLDQGAVASDRSEAYRWLTRASELNHPFAAAERDALESEMSLGELRMARSNEPLTVDASAGDE